MNESTVEQQVQDNVEHRTMREILAELRGVREAATAVDMAMTSIGQQEQALKDELRSGMEAAGIKSGKGSGLMVQLKTRKSTRIVDEGALTEAMLDAGVLQDYIKTSLNGVTASKAALENSWPGVAIEEMTYLSIGEVK